MTAYEANAVGSAELSLPEKIRTGDTLQFNITNTDIATKYTGTILCYEFPDKCKVRLHAYGARGGYGNLYKYGLTDTTRSGNGAYISGVFEFEKGDQVLLLVGQAGTDAMTSTSSTKDQTTGAGGGGTFIVKKTTTGDTFVGNSTNGSNVYNGWLVTPLVVAAGGNGGADNGYSGTGTIYGGLAETGTQPTYAKSRTGGGYNTAYGTTSSTSSSYGYGLSFLNGGLGSKYNYTRSTTSRAGFGGGGSNADDGDGGGGGGYYGGIVSVSATSYVNTTLGTDTTGTSDMWADEGKIVFEFLSVGSFVANIRVNGSYKPAEAGYVKVNGVWKPAEAIYTKVGGVWKKGIN